MNNQTTSIRERFQFVVILYLFLPSLMDSLYGLVDNKNIKNTAGLNLSFIIAFLICNYLIIEFLKDDLRNWLKKTLSILIPAQIGMFVPILFLFGSLQETVSKFPSTIIYWIFKIAVFGVIWIPIVTFLLLFFELVFNLLKKHKITS